MSVNMPLFSQGYIKPTSGDVHPISLWQPTIETRLTCDLRVFKDWGLYGAIGYGKVPLEFNVSYNQPSPLGGGQIGGAIAQWNEYNEPYFLASLQATHQEIINDKFDWYWKGGITLVYLPFSETNYNSPLGFSSATVNGYNELYYQSLTYNTNKITPILGAEAGGVLAYKLGKGHQITGLFSLLYSGQKMMHTAYLLEIDGIKSKGFFYRNFDYANIGLGYKYSFGN